MAEVKMDLAELKQLEDKIETLEKEKQNLIDSQHQVVVYHKYFEGRIKPGIPKSGMYIQTVTISGTMRTFSGVEYFNRDIDLNQALEKGLIEIDLKELTSKTTKDYKNLSEIIIEIRKEEESKVQESIEKALDRATKAEYDITVIEDKYKKKLLASCDNYNKTIEKLENSNTELEKEYEQKLTIESKTAEEKYSKLLQEFNDFKEDRKRLSLEEQIAELQAKLLEATKPKSFLARLLNK